MLTMIFSAVKNKPSADAIHSETSKGKTAEKNVYREHDEHCA